MVLQAVTFIVRGGQIFPTGLTFKRALICLLILIEFQPSDATRARRN
jgi:hypothetical protein